MSMKWWWPNGMRDGVGVIALAVVLTAGASVCAHAGGIAGIVFDPSNYVENSLTAANGVNEVQNQVQQYLLQKTGLNLTLQDLKSLPMSQVNDMIASHLPSTGNYPMNYDLLLQQAEKSIGVSTQSVQQQFKALTASGLSPADYLKQETDIANSDQAYAAAGFKQAENAVKQTDAEAQQVQQQAGKIGETVGDVSSMDVMETQLNTLEQQNRQLIQLVAAQQKINVQLTSQKAAEKKQQDEQVQQINQDYGATQNPDEETQQFGQGLSQYDQ